MIYYEASSVEGSKIIELCQKGDQLLDEEISKVYKGKKIPKGTGPPSSTHQLNYLISLKAPLTSQPSSLRYFPPDHGVSELICDAIHSVTVRH